MAHVRPVTLALFLLFVAVSMGKGAGEETNPTDNLEAGHTKVCDSNTLQVLLLVAVYSALMVEVVFASEI
jgi:hypothetical protein